MTPDPDRGWSWQPAGMFIEDVVLQSRRSVFPVVDVTGDPVGAVTVDRLTLLAPRDVGVPLEGLSVPLPPDRIVAPDGPVVALLQMAPVTGDRVAVVVADHRLLGLVTTDDVHRMLRRNRLWLRSPAV